MSRRRLKSKNKSRHSRGGGMLDTLKGFFGSSNPKSSFWSFLSSDNYSQDNNAPDSLSFGPMQIPPPPPMPVGQPQMSGRPMAPPAQVQPQQLQSSSSMQASPAAGGRRRRRTYKNKRRK